jgi:non-homologous end joining protein Ku
MAPRSYWKGSSEDIDERYLDKPYHIVSNGTAGTDAFVVIRGAMKRKERVALARVGSRTRGRMRKVA